MKMKYPDGFLAKVREVFSDNPRIERYIQKGDELGRLLEDSQKKFQPSQIIVPSIREAAGHGTCRLYGILDLKQAFLIQQLRKADWKPKQIAKALSAVAPAVQDPDLLHTPLLVHEGNALLILCRSKVQELILLDAASPEQYVMVIALDALEEEMRKSLARSR